MTTLGTATDVVQQSGDDRRRIQQDRRKQLAVPAVVALFVLVLAVTTDGFLSAGNAQAILSTASVVGIAAVGMSVITLSGNFVSLGTQPMAVLAGVTFLYLLKQGWNPILAMVVVLVLLGALSAIQGVVVANGLNPVIVTLAAGAITAGALASATGGKVVTQGASTAFMLNNPKVGGVPLSILVFGLLTLVASLVSAYSVFGRRVLLVGSNRETAQMSGISYRGTTILSFLFFGLMLGVAGIVYVSQLGQVTANDMPTLTTDVIAAVLVGGTAVRGGEGSPFRSALGAIIVSTFDNVMVLHGFEVGFRLLLTGLLVAVVVLLMNRLSESQGM